MYVADKQFGLHTGPPITRAGVVPQLAVCLPISHAPKWTDLSGLGGKDAPSLAAKLKT